MESSRKISLIVWLKSQSPESQHQHLVYTVHSDESIRRSTDIVFKEMLSWCISCESTPHLQRTVVSLASCASRLISSARGRVVSIQPAHRSINLHARAEGPVQCLGCGWSTHYQTCLRSPCRQTGSLLLEFLKHRHTIQKSVAHSGTSATCGTTSCSRKSLSLEGLIRRRPHTPVSSSPGQGRKGERAFVW
jgi:hypothetical protein